MGSQTSINGRREKDFKKVYIKKNWTIEPMETSPTYLIRLSVLIISPDPGIKERGCFLSPS